jgi:hypothetical protein
MSEKIQLHGANARARGESYMDNPYLKSANMPAKTGETIEEWAAKQEAWALGWQMEDMIR